MDKLIKDAIEESCRDYQECSIGMDENECWAHEEGWKDGYPLPKSKRYGYFHHDRIRQHFNNRKIKTNKGFNSCTLLNN